MTRCRLSGLVRMRPTPRTGRDRRIVGMHRELDAGLLGDRHHALQEDLHPLPEAVLGDFAEFGRAAALHLLVVVAGHQRAAAVGERHRGAQPAEPGHEVVAHDRDAGAAHVVDQLAEAVERPVELIGALLDRLHQNGRRRFDDLQVDPVVGEVLLQPQERFELPDRRIVRTFRQADDRRGHSGLLGELPQDRPLGGQDIGNRQAPGHWRGSLHCVRFGSGDEIVAGSFRRTAAAMRGAQRRRIGKNVRS